METTKEIEQFKILIIGDSDVGKTSLLSKYLKNEKVISENLPTIGVECQSKEITIDNKTYIIQFWDTAGQERFKSIVKSFYRGAHGIIYVCDVMNKESYNRLNDWFHNVNEVTSQCQGIIIGNKIDIEGRIVSHEDLINISQQIHCDFFETSAITGINVNEAFLDIIQKVVNAKYEASIDGNSLRLNVNNNKNKGCCK